jgi:hypothetical protein
MSYGIIEFNENGLPKCEICDQHFKRVLTHVRQKHQMTEKEYKTKFGFDLTKGICSEESSKKSRENTLLNFDRCIKKNLIEKGIKTRFNIGSEGRTRIKVSHQTRLRLIERLKEHKMIELMRINGKKLGETNLGNKIRWRKIE